MKKYTQGIEVQQEQKIEERKSWSSCLLPTSRHILVSHHFFFDYLYNLPEGYMDYIH